MKYDWEDQLELRFHTHVQAVVRNRVAVWYISASVDFTEVVACREERGRRMIVPCDWNAPSLLQTLPAAPNSPEKALLALY